MTGLAGQPFPMRFVGEIGHMEEGQQIPIEVATAIGKGDGVVRLEGKNWSIQLNATGGIWWTEVFVADFDRDGRDDILIGSHFPGLGRCADSVAVTVVLFDAKGRPVPWALDTYLPRVEGDKFPFIPIQVTGKGSGGRAEIVTTDCSGRTVGIYEARGGRLVLRRGGPVLLPGYSQNVVGVIEELTSGGSGDSILISGKRYKDWPTRIVTDFGDRREIDMEGGQEGLLRAFRNKWPVVRWDESGTLAVDGRGATRIADLRVDFVVDGSTKTPNVARRSEGVVGFRNEVLRRGPSEWQRTSGAKEEVLLPDGVTIRTSHTAMQHTVTGETRYARPPGLAGHRMTGMIETGDVALTQWGRGLFALHSLNGELIAPRVSIETEGDLGFGGGDVTLIRADGELVTLHGHFRWRRIGN